MRRSLIELDGVSFFVSGVSRRCWPGALETNESILSILS